MLAGSWATMRSKPAACIRRLVSATRLAYSALSKGLSYRVMLGPPSGLDDGAGSGLARGAECVGRDRRILRAGSGQVADGDVLLRPAAAGLSGDDVAQLRWHAIDQMAGRAGGAELAQLFALRRAIAHKEVACGQRCRIDLVR